MADPTGMLRASVQPPCSYASTARIAVVAAPVATALVFLRPAYDTFSTPKVLAAALAAGTAVAVLAVALARRHSVTIPWAPVTPAVLTFSVIAVIATVTGGAPVRSIIGASGARSGLLLYLACAALLLVTATVFRAGSAVWVLRALLAAAVPAVAYAVAQWAGRDPFSWSAASAGPPIFSTFGNTNFLSAWLGIVCAVALWGALTSTWRRPWRVASAALGMAAFAVAIASQSVQGPLAGVAGALVVSVAGFRRDPSRRRAKAFTLAALLVAGAAWLVAAGDVARSFEGRLWKWSAALAMTGDRPFTGVGFDQYGDWYHAYRPTADALARGVQRTADNAHNVGLQLLSGGGVPLLLAYLAVVALTGAALVKGLRRLEGEDRLLLAALGGAWVAYQLQSLVSIDVAPLAVTHWMLSGLILAVATPDDVPRLRRCAHQPWGVPAVASITLLAGVGLVLWSVPLRADVAARRAIRASTAGQDLAAEQSFAIARGLAPWEERYDVAYGRHLQRSGDIDGALRVYSTARAKAPRSLPIALIAARAAADNGRYADAAVAYAAARELDDRSPDLIAEETLNERKVAPQAAAPIRAVASRTR